MVTMSFLGPALICRWKISAQQEALIQLAVFLGALLSSPIMGFLSDLIGASSHASLTYCACREQLDDFPSQKS
jgi:MFS family permease